MTPDIRSACFTLFDTAIGICGVAWTERGLTCVELPGPSAASCRSRMRRRHPHARETSAAPPAIRRTIDAIVALLRGEPVDLGFVEIDWDGQPPSHRRIYEAARAVGPGRTVTYGELAARIGEPGAARAVGQALGRNPYAIVVPCHRVLAAGGGLGGFSAPGGVSTKRRLLAIERARGLTAPLFG